ncbi:conserved protein of unknown function [Tenacibaculum sp. 190130A14a]|uniref:TonB C-terminal domain-containing protein n=1 Tax=Tenacibaculum polynesiense TaxID=3137857 RepID=A0ABP1EZN5_9FLAO
MRIRFFLWLLILLTYSCNKFSSSGKHKLQLDTIIDYTKVDVSPAFVNCDHLEGNAKAKCFENELQEKVHEELIKHAFSVKEDIDETVLLIIQINKKGKVKLEEIQSSNNIKSKFPNLDSILKKSIEKLPIITPATKKGFPVITEYTLPIRIANG